MKMEGNTDNMGKRASLSIGFTDQPRPDVRPLSPEELQADQQTRVDAAIAKQSSLEAKIVAAIKQVQDPEIPVNIYDLGLIYRIDIKEGNAVEIDMTLTSAACPAAQELPVQVRSAVSRVPEVGEVEVEVVFSPPWSQAHMSEEAKLVLGLL
jgi:FeS assembly SUF system protein